MKQRKNNKTKTSGISKKLKKLEDEQRKKVSEIQKEYSKKIEDLTKDHIFCEGDDLGWDEHFDFKKNKVTYGRSKFKACNDWVLKKDFAYVDIECFENMHVSSDCGYGDYDEFAVTHLIKHYRVCRKCGKAVLLDNEIVMDGYGIPDRSETWCRCDSDSYIERVIKEYKERTNAKFEKQLGMKPFDEDDGSVYEFSKVTSIRDKPYVPNKR